MKKVKVIREVKSKIKSLTEVKKENSPKSFVASETEPQITNDSHVSRSSFSPTLEKINDVQEAKQNGFTKSESEKREESTRFYESAQNRRQEKLKYEPATQRQVVGEVGLASAQASASAQDFLDRRNPLTRPDALSSQNNVLDRISPGQDRDYKMSEESQFHVKRRKELY